MTQERWEAIDRYISDLLVRDDPGLRRQLPPHDVAPNQGKLLHVLARAVGARRVLELGTLGGYSTIWLARALPADGKVVTLEVNSGYAEVARENLTSAGVADRVEVIVGPALETLARLEGPFDLIFIDADKRSNAEYLRLALELSRPGTLIVADNVIREGQILNPATGDQSVLGVREFFQALGRESRVTATAVQTVGSKGHDGFAIAVVLDGRAG